MIDMSYEEAVKKIQGDSGLSEEEIQKKIDEKLSQLSGLISKDGAAHIIANELGVQLAKQVEPGQSLKINEVTLHSRGISVTGRVVRKYEVRSFNKEGRQGRVASVLFGDETGVTRLVFWNDQVDAFEALKEDDVLVVQNPIVKESFRKDGVELQLNDQSSLTVNPEGVTVAKPKITEKPRIQKYIKDLQGDENNAEIVATMVQVYDPRFYDACPECRKKLSPENQCASHGEVAPEVNFNMSCFLDDGTGNIRTSFWKQQALVLTGKSDEDFVKFREDPTAFEDVKTALLGEIIKVVGNVKKNEQFDRLEFTANLVFKDIDPAKEIANLEKKFGSRKDEPVKEEVISLEDLEKMGQ